MENQKIPLELSIEVLDGQRYPTRLTKILYAGFVPQHGMQIMDTEIFFRVKTIVLAGLQTLKHTASPLMKNNFVQGDRKVTSRLFPKNDEQVRESIEFFKKNGWKLDR